MDPTDAGTTCAVMPHIGANGKKIFYPLQRVLHALCRRPNFFVLGAYECCRDLIAGNQYHEKYAPTWLDELESRGTNEGSWVDMHACLQGASVIDMKVKEPAYEADEIEARDNQLRLSFGLPAYMRKICNDKVKNGGLTW